MRAIETCITKVHCCFMSYFKTSRHPSFFIIAHLPQSQDCLFLIKCCCCHLHVRISLPLCLPFSFLSTVSVEFGRAVWLRFYPPAFPPCPNPSFVAHLGGVVVGLTLGVVVLQNYEQRLQEQSLFWIFFCVYTLFVLCAVFWNIFAYSLLDVRLPPPPWVAY